MERNDKTAKLLGLFMAALLTVTAGCGASEQSRAGHTHIDRNNDGYCDEDGEPMPARSGGGGFFYGAPFFFGSTRSGIATPGQTADPGRGAAISSGKAAHGGIGSTHTGGGG